MYLSKAHNGDSSKRSSFVIELVLTKMWTYGKTDRTVFSIAVEIKAIQMFTNYRLVLKNSIYMQFFYQMHKIFTKVPGMSFVFVFILQKILKNELWSKVMSMPKFSTKMRNQHIDISFMELHKLRRMGRTENILFFLFAFMLWMFGEILEYEIAWMGRRYFFRKVARGSSNCTDVCCNTLIKK